MGNRYYFLLLICFCLLKTNFSAPLSSESAVVDADFCTSDDFLKYQNGREYSYDYSTQTDLWINDVSEESRSSVELKAKVFVRSVQPCLYLLRLESASLTGESLNQQNVENVVQNLNDNSVQFRLNSRGELDSSVDFTQGDSAWSRNIKRGILSAIQLRSLDSLRNLDQSLEATNDAKSAVVYETDVLGRCRTTYLVRNPSAANVLITKRKSLQRCTLNENSKTSAVQYVPYKNIPEFYQGRLFVETHECTTQVKDGLIQQVNCEEHSTYKVGSRGSKGVQAVVKQTLTYLNVVNGYDRRAHGPFESHNIKFEFTDKSVDDAEYRNFNVDKYLSDLCSRVESNSGLDVEHSNNFRALVNSHETKSRNDLYNLYTSSKAKCDLAGLTVSQALVFANSENSFETVLRLLDENAFSNQGTINEYPVLTALARLQEPSLNLLKNLKTYLQKKDKSFAYLKKLSLVFSSLVKSFCSKNQCDEQLLNDFSSIFESNLGSNCADSSSKQLVTTSLKAIGNIGSFNNLNTLVECALNKANNLETRVSAIQSFRRFDVEKILTRARGLIDLLKNTDQDTELRINAFQVLIRGVDTELFQKFARDSLPELLEKETDLQFLTYVVDFAKERGITALLNPILSNQQLKEKFSVNFKELSWNNFKYRYSLNRDGALELDTSVIYVSDRSFIPRSIRFNATLHLFGMSVNFADVTLRTEGLEDILKSVLVDKLTSEQLLKRMMSTPEQLIDIVKAIADKLKYTQDKPFLSVLIRVYGSDVFYSELDSLDKLKRLSDFLKSPRENLLYAQVNTIKNMFLVDSRVRQPLLNGFEFNTFMDTSLGLLLVKQSTKTDSNEKRDFNVKNFYSASLAINKRFEIQINKDNKLSIKKKAILNGRLRLDIQGQKTTDSVVYNWNLTPLEEIPLLVVDGKFFKLSTNSQYKEVTKFNVERHTLERCTSENFHNGLGIDLCLSVDRPKVGSILESLKSVDLDRVLNDMDDQDDDNDDEEDQSLYGSIQRPKLVLSGPYHFEVRLKNPERVKTLTLNGQRVKTDSSKKLTATLKTVSFSNEIKNRLEFVYSRNRVDTNRGIERHLNVELKNAQTQDVRFRLVGDVVYKRTQVLNVRFDLENKILREINLNLNLLREKNEENIIPTYKLEALLNSKLIDNKYKRFTLNLQPNGRDIESNLLIEKSDESTDFKNLQIAQGSLRLKSKNEKKVDYDLSLNYETKRPSSLKVTGKLSADLFKSDVELTILYNGPNIQLNEPATLRFGHVVDLSSADSPSFVQIGLKHPSRNVNHNVKIIFQGNPVEMKLNRLEVQLTTPKSHAQNNGLPFIVYLSKQENNNENGDQNVQITLGLNNFLIDLSTRESKVAKSLIKLDSDPIVKSLSIEYSRTKDSSKKLVQISLRTKKNNLLFGNVQFTKIGSLSDVRLNPSEVPRQSLISNLQVKVFENSASADAKFEFESSLKSKKHLLNFDFKTDGLLKILLKLISIKSRFELNGSRINSEYEMKKIGEVRSFGFSTRKDSQIRSSPNGLNEFDVEYLKVLGSNQQIKSTGTVRYQFRDLKNFDASLDIKNNYRFSLSVKNERKLKDKLFGVHDVRMKYAHLDAFQVEREYALYINNEAQPNTLELNVLAKKAQPNKLNQVDELDYVLDLKTINRFSYGPNGKRRLENGANSLVLKSKKLNIDVNAKCDALGSERSNQFNLEGSLDAKFPAFLSEPGKVNTLKHRLTLNKDFKGERKSFTSQIETDNKYLTRVFKSLNIDYSREMVNLNLTNVNAKINWINENDQSKFLNVFVERTHCANGMDSVETNVGDDDSGEESTEQVLTGLNKFKQLCSATKLNVKQNLLPKVDSRLLEGKSFDTSDCTLQTLLIRNKQIEPSYNYNLDVFLNAECSGLVFLKNALSVKRNSDSARNDMKTTELSVDVQSDMYFEPRHVDIKHKKFYAKSGLFVINWQRSSQKVFLVNIEYNRELDSTTNKLSKGKYVLNTELGETVYKNCELNIESKYSYYNRLNCRIKTNRLPVELGYGYSLKVLNVNELPNGKRDVQLTIDLPSTRQLRIEYDSQRAVLSQQQFDDDDDDNNDREFTSNVKYFWDYSRDQSKVLLVKLRRDNYGQTNSKLTAEATSPSFKSLKLIVDRKRLFNETDILVNLSYELENNVSNELQVNSKLTSNFETSQLSLELSLSRPSFNILYENRFNKLNGRLQYLSVRVGKLLKFSVDKEFDPENRQIRLELVSPDETKFRVDTTLTTTSTNVNVVASHLRLLGSNQVLSTLESRFDSNNNVFDVNLNAVQAKQQYSFNFGLYNESLANAVIRHVTNNNQVLGVGSVQIVNINDDDITDDSDNRYVQVSLKWNRLWNKIYSDILANQGGELKAVENSGFNSYFGDVFVSIANDLRATLEKIKTERRQVKDELRQLLLLLADFYSSALPAHVKENLIRTLEAKQKDNLQEQENLDRLPLHKRLFAKYNQLAVSVNKLHFRIRKISKKLSDVIPRLTMIAYNPHENGLLLNRMANQFDNYVVASKPTNNARNLYQLNAEYRDRLRRISNRFLSVKSGLLRNLGGANLRALINKYKLRRLNDFTIVAHIFNRRNLVTFNGESRVLKARCKFLLAHELTRNQFSVILNSNNEKASISVSAYGQPSIDINSNQAFINNRPLALPYKIDLKDKNAQILVKKSHNSISVQVNNDLLVTCYDDSKSCSVALTRWYTGKVNGLLGRSNYNLDQVDEDYWYLDSSCKLPSFQAKQPSDEAVKTCFSIFGKHRKAVFRNALQAINPVGWQKLCEFALNADLNNKCPVMRAFVYHAKLRKIEVNEPNDCFQCQAKSKSVSVGQKFIGSSADLFVNGNDYVFVLLPCDKSKFSLDLSASARGLSLKNPQNRYYFVKVHENNGASIYQSESGQIFNFDVRKAQQTIAEDKTLNNLQNDDFYHGLFLAGSLFTNRLAQNRYLIIVGCGNCLRYSSKAAVLLDRLFTKRNIVVSAWDNYDIVDGDLTDETIIGYGQGKVFLAKKGTNQVDTESIDSFRFEHRADLCSRLAVKTNGNIFNINHVKRPEVFEQVANHLAEIKSETKYETRLGTCERVDTPFGDVDDFSYRRIQVAA